MTDPLNIVCVVLLCLDILWLNDQVLISCSKDGKVIQQLFSGAFRPVERAVSFVIALYVIILCSCIDYDVVTTNCPSLPFVCLTGTHLHSNSNIMSPL